MSLFKKTSKTSEQLEGFLRTPTVLFHTGVWQYPLGDGRVQNFNARCWSRRWSYDGRSDRRTSLPFVTNDTAEPLEYSKNGKLMRSLYHIVNSFKHYISRVRLSQKDHRHQNPETVPTTTPIQTEHLLRNGSKLIFLDLELGRKSQQTRSSHRRWSLNDASQAKNRAIISPPDETPITDTDSSSTQSPPPKSRLRIFTSRITFFLFTEISFPLAKLLCLPCRLKRRAKARKVRRRCEKHQEIIRQLAEQLEPAVEERGGGGEMPLEFRMWEYAMDELDEREKAKYAFTPAMLLNWLERFFRWRGYRV